MQFVHASHLSLHSGPLHTPNSPPINLTRPIPHRIPNLTTWTHPPHNLQCDSPHSIISPAWNWALWDSFILPRIQRRQLEESAILVTRDPSGLNPLRRSTSYYFTVTGENGRRRSNLGGDEPEKAVVERKRKQQEKRTEEKSNSCENILWTSSSGELQLAKALRQQRSSESSLRRSWLVRRRRRNHLSQGKSNLIKLFIDLNEMVRLTFYLRYIIVSYRSR